MNNNFDSFYFFVVNFFKCYECKGLDDGWLYLKLICEKELIVVICLSDNYICGIYYYEIKLGVLVNEVEVRLCVVDCCYVELLCRVIILVGGKCIFLCCDEDLCNIGIRIIF